MPFMRSAFAQLLEPLDRRIVARAVAAHDGDKGVGSGAGAWTCRRHLTALLFAQIAGLTSLRQIVEALGAQREALYHLDLRQPRRSTLSDANQARPAAVFGDIARALLPVAARMLRRDGEALIRLVDATPIPLRDARFGWAEASGRCRGLKLHLAHDPNECRPVWFALTSAKIDDVVAGRGLPLERGATYVFDKGYTDYRWWAAIIAAGAVFVTRRKTNARRREVAEQPVQGEGILADRRLKIGHRQPQSGAPKNPLWQVPLREIVVRCPDRPEPLCLLTNDFDRPAVEIAQLYRQRWDIELLFKWIKQNLKIRRFLGRSENAVRIQIYVALIAFMLLRIFRHTAARSCTATAALLLARLRVALFARLDLRSRPPPTPTPPALRTPSPQFRFAFR